MSGSDPRVPKSRQPKQYTDEQLGFLKSHLPEYETRSLGSVRGDSKKFAYAKAAEYIARFGVSSEFTDVGGGVVEDGEGRFKEQIYNWFKNTVGRNRRKAEGRTRPSAASRKALALAQAGPSGSMGEKGTPALSQPTASNALLPPSSNHSLSPTSSANGIQQWNPYAQQHPHPHSQQSAASSSSALGQAMGSPGSLQGYHTPGQLGGGLASTSNAHNINHGHGHASHPGSMGGNTHSPFTPHAHPTPTTGSSTPSNFNALRHPNAIPPQPVTQHTLREAFLSPTLDAPTLGSLMTTFALHTQPHSPTPLNAVVDALFEASLVSEGRETGVLVRRFWEGAGYLPGGGPNSNGGGTIAGGHGHNGQGVGPVVTHAGVSGPGAAARALQMAVRRNSVWVGVEKVVPSSSAVGAGSLMGVYGSSADGQGQGYYNHQHQHQHGTASPMPSGSGTPGLGSLSEDMQRMVGERQRRKEFIQWARIHAATIEVGVMGPVSSSSSSSSAASNPTSPLVGVDGLAVAASDGGERSRAFAEVLARDAVWEADEAEWVAGMYVLRALIRTSTSAVGAKKGEYREWVGHYERRWREIKDEGRQTMLMEALMEAREEVMS